MRRTTRFAAALLAVVTLVACQRATAAELTFFGDFEDGFGPGTSYDSGTPYSPGFFDLVFSELVLGIPKFDPALGTLTDITVFIEDTDPIFYDVMGDISADEFDDMLPDFSAAVEIFGDVGVNYETPGGSLAPVIIDFFDLSGGCMGMTGDMFCGDGLFASADGVLDGSESIFGSVDLADFVGLGPVDSLFVQLFMESTAVFPDLTNVAGAFAGTGFDVFDGDSGADDTVVGVTYTFTPIPEPTSLLLAVPALALLVGKRRRK